MVTARQDSSAFAALTAEQARIADDLVRHIRDTLSRTGASPLLSESSEYVLSVVGKLVRPLLMLEACRAAGGDPEHAFPAAVGTEYGQVASLIHDDIMDGDAERRGQESLHIRFNVPAAVLTGDLFIFHTFLNFTECQDRGVSAERVLAAIRMLSTTCIEMCQGQALETTVSGDLTISEATYLDVIRLKTASFCRAAAHIGALLGGADDASVEALGGYGEHLGMTFQIIDDCLPYTSDAAVVGKPHTSDIENRRVTLPIIYALQSDDPAVRREIEEIWHAGASAVENAHRRLTIILESTRALDRVRALAYSYTNRAKRHLDLLPYSPSRENLRTLADTLIARAR